MTRALLLASLLGGCVPRGLVEQAADRDRDGFRAEELGGPDCDDSDPTVHPDADEICGDAIDNNCDRMVDDVGIGQLSWYRDSDGDGYGDPALIIPACTAPEGYVANADDCRDARGDVYPGAPEVCDGVDNDCDDSADESAVDRTTWYRDVDGDGFGGQGPTQLSCDQPDGYAASNTDCDDAIVTVNPEAPEVCDGLDNDCDDLVDLDDPSMSGVATWYRDVDGDGWGIATDTLESCTQPAGYALNVGDCADGVAAIHPAADEVCNAGIDDDCDGLADQADLGLDLSTRSAWYLDSDGDGFGRDHATLACSAPSAAHVLVSGDCDDVSIWSARVWPGAPEVCDGVLNDCNAAVVPATEVDNDGDDFVECDVAAGPGWVGAGPSVPGGNDCDDTSAVADRRYPGAAEICDGVIDNCGAPTVPADEIDNDGDRYVECTITAAGNWQGSVNILAGGDCDDTSAWANSVYPGAPEQCDGVKNNCLLAAVPPGEVDNDGDGWVDCEFAPGDWHGTPISGGGDCVDVPSGSMGILGNLIHPARTEICNNDVDDDCNHYAPECRFSGDWGIASADARIEGAGPNDRLGRSLAAGRFDTDARDDLVIGSGWFFCCLSGNAELHDAGALYLASGRATWPASLGVGTPIATGTAGSSTTVHVITEQLLACDIDDDGLDDVLFTDSIYKDLTLGIPWLKRTQSVYGFFAPLPVNVTTSSADVALLVPAGASLALLFHVDACGDLGGGGAPDLGFRYNGSPRLLYGPLTGDYVGDAADATGLVGASHTSFGQFDVDAESEWLIGSTSGSGTVYALHDAPSDDEDLTMAGRIVNSVSGTGFGSKVAGLDWNGDGWGDVAVWSSVAGSVRIYLGPHTWLDGGTRDASSWDVDIGSGVSFGGTWDVDGDGASDLLLVKETAEGEILLFYGGPSRTGSVSIAQADARFVGGVDGQSLGDAVRTVAVGDFNGDGGTDLAVGAPEWSQSEQGAVFLFLGDGH